MRLIPIHFLFFVPSWRMLQFMVLDNLASTAIETLHTDQFLVFITQSTSTRDTAAISKGTTTTLVLRLPKPVFISLRSSRFSSRTSVNSPLQQRSCLACGFCRESQSHAWPCRSASCCSAIHTFSSSVPHTYTKVIIKRTTTIFHVSQGNTLPERITCCNI